MGLNKSIATHAMLGSTPPEPPPGYGRWSAGIVAGLGLSWCWAVYRCLAREVEGRELVPPRPTRDLMQDLHRRNVAAGEAAREILEAAGDRHDGALPGAPRAPSPPVPRPEAAAPPPDPGEWEPAGFDEWSPALPADIDRAWMERVYRALSALCCRRTSPRPPPVSADVLFKLHANGAAPHHAALSCLTWLGARDAREGRTPTPPRPASACRDLPGQGMLF